MKLLKSSSSGIVTVLVCTILVTALINLRASPRGGGIVPARQNGDVNCDGKFDISDAISMLSYLFQDGPEPCAIAQEGTNCCPEIAQKLDRLIELAEGPCEKRDDRLESMKIGQDLIVVDHCTGLMWSGNPLGVDLDLDGVPDRVFNCNQLTNLLKSLSYAGFQDWRLPTVLETQSLMRLIESLPYKAGNGIPGFHLPINYYTDSTIFRTSTPFEDDPLSAHYAAIFATESKSEFQARSDSDKLGALLVRKAE